MENFAVRPPLCRLLVFSFLVSCSQVSISHAQAPTPGQSSASPIPVKLDFPDSTSGLERLTKEIFKAQKDGDSARASALARSMVLPDPAAWYLQTFGSDIANEEGSKYTADQSRLPTEILTFFFEALQNHNTEITAARFAETCDDNAG